MSGVAVICSGRMMQVVDGLILLEPSWLAGGQVSPANCAALQRDAAFGFPTSPGGSSRSRSLIFSSPGRSNATVKLLCAAARGSTGAAENVSTENEAPALGAIRASSVSASGAASASGRSGMGPPPPGRRRLQNVAQKQQGQPAVPG